MNAVASAPSPVEKTARPAVPTVRRTFVVNLEHGLHARPCAMVVQTLQPFPVLAEVEADGEKASAKSILGLMSLAAGAGSKITFTIIGERAFQAMTALERLFETRFGMNSPARTPPPGAQRP